MKEVFSIRLMSKGKKAIPVSRSNSADSRTAFSLSKLCSDTLIEIPVSIIVEIVALGVLKSFREGIPENRHHFLTLLGAHFVCGAGNNPDILVLDACPVERQQEQLIQMKRICDAAHKAGIPVMTHVDDIHDSLVAVRGGTDTLEHLINPESYDHEVTQELIDEMLKRGVPLIPTIIATYHLEIDLNSPFSVVDAVLKDVKILKDAGVPIGVGCDSGNNAVYFGKSVHEEMAWLVKAGLTPLEAITAATGVDAKALGIADDRGTIEPGKRADLVVLRKDPLEDIANTLSIEAVYKAGRIVR